MPKLFLAGLLGIALLLGASILVLVALDKRAPATPPGRPRPTTPDAALPAAVAPPLAPLPALPPIPPPQPQPPPPPAGEAVKVPEEASSPDARPVRRRFNRPKAEPGDGQAPRPRVMEDD